MTPLKSSLFLVVEMNDFIKKYAAKKYQRVFYNDTKLVTKFIKPVYPDYALDIILEVKERVQAGESVRYEMDISCANQHGLLVIVGRATAWAR